jgi:biopolymer transport protein ExbD/biopolymer transport protein TolR
MAGGVGTGKRGADINVVPLIDIVLVLLIIFMVITPLIIKQMDVHLPEVIDEPVPTPTPDQPQKPQIVVLVQCKSKPADPNAECFDYQVYLGKDPIEEAALEPALKAMIEGRSDEDKVLFFDAEDQVNYRASIHVLDIARGAGITKIGLITDRTNLAPPPPGAPGAPGAPAVPGAPVPGAP